jgi:multicomponent Na+:H+ antiporter subunit F
MSDSFMLAATLLLATVGAALIRAWRGPTRADRIMAVQLVGTGVVGVAVTLGAARGDAAMLDAALVGTLLATVAVTTFVRGFATRHPERGPKDPAV